MWYTTVTMFLINVFFEVVGAWLVWRALLGAPVADAVGWSALWALESVFYYMSVDDTASMAAALVRSIVCAAYWIQARVCA